MSSADRSWRPATRVGLYVLGLVAVFAAAFLTAGAIAPAGTGDGDVRDVEHTDVVEHTPKEGEPGEPDGH